MVVIPAPAAPSDIWIAPLFALAGVIASVTVSLVIASRSTYTNYVTAERTKWLQNVRTNISRLCSLLWSLSERAKASPQYKDSDAGVRDKTEITRMITLISLQLNPRADVDRSIIRIIEKMAWLTEDPMDIALPKAEAVLVKYTQWLLKVEWERIKTEAGERKRQTRKTPEEYDEEYKLFCSHYPLTSDIAIPDKPFLPVRA